MNDNKTLEFLDKLKDKGYLYPEYDYSKVVYKSARDKIIIIDEYNLEHGILVKHLLMGTKCCQTNAVNQTEYFLKQLESKGYLYPEYDYSKVVYKSARDKVIVIDEYNLEHKISAALLLRGNKCCQINVVNQTEYFLKQLENRGYLFPEYDYTEVLYKSENDKVIIIDEYNLEHEILPGSLLNGTKCGQTNAVNQTEYFLKQLESKGYLYPGYDYSKVEYKSVKGKVIIIDEYNLEHELTTGDLLSGVKCTQTNAFNQTEYFLKQLENRGYLFSEYDYSKVEYKSSKDKIIIIDEYNLEHEILPGSLLVGYKCVQTNAINQTEYFLKQLETRGYLYPEYDYSKVKYNGNRYKVIIIDEYNLEHELSPGNLLGGAKCGQTNAVNQTEYFLKQLESKGYLYPGYDYSKVEYKSVKGKVIIIDEYNLEYEISAKHLLEGTKCTITNRVEPYFTYKEFKNFIYPFKLNSPDEYYAKYDEFKKTRHPLWYKLPPYPSYTYRQIK